MKWHFEDKTTQGEFMMLRSHPVLSGKGMLNDKLSTTNTIVYNTGDAQMVTIDEITYTLPAQYILPLVANQHFIFERPEQLVAWQFNREFYCIADHDAEVGCVGFLFYGIQHPLFIPLTAEEKMDILMLEQLFVEDMAVKDKMQGEMLRTLLKRLIIKVTRIAKKHTESYQQFSDERLDVVRTFNLLLEVHFRTQHEVQFYAQAMNRSPKTLTNLFGQFNHPPPSKLIQRRIILEAKRYLHYTSKSAKEIAEELGFVSAAHFSRFFKLNTGVNFSGFREQAQPLIQSVTAGG